MRTFAEKLRAARESAGLSRAELGRRAGLSEDTVCKLERQGGPYPRLDTATLLAHVLGVTLDSLRPEIEPPNEPARPRESRTRKREEQPAAE